MSSTREKEPPCSSCHRRPRRPNQRTCDACHAEYMQRYRLKQRLELEQLRALALRAHPEEVPK